MPDITLCSEVGTLRATVEACDIADEMLNGCEVDETLDAKRIDDLRALAAGKVTP